MTLIVDASVALKWVLRQPDSQLAWSIPQRFSLSAPAFWRLESASVLWKFHRKHLLTDAELTIAFMRLDQAPVDADDAAVDVGQALDLASELGHPVYDCLYLAVALRRDATVVTADGGFAEAASRNPVYRDRVRLLESFAG